MTDYLLLFVGTVLVNNFVLVKFLGLCPFMGVSKKLETAMGMGLATTFVMTMASICAWLIDTWILIPLDMLYLRTLSFILSLRWLCSSPKWWCVKPVRPCIACWVFFCLSSPPTVRCWAWRCSTSTLGIISCSRRCTVFPRRSVFSFVMVLFASIRERLAAADIPAPFRGNAIALVTAGLMSLAFMGFSGLVKL